MKRQFESELEKRAREINFPPLKIMRWEAQPLMQAIENNQKYRPDAIVEIGWENKSYQFVAEVFGQGGLKTIDQAIYQVEMYIAALQKNDPSNRYYPLLITTHLGKEKLERLVAAQVSGLDLSGNGVVIVPGKIFVYRSGAENKFPSSAPIKNVFRGVSAIVPRVFFAKPNYASVSEVWQEITERSGTTTLATVSKVLKTLEEELLIARKADGIRLLDGKGLLTKLQESYRSIAPVRRILGKVSDPDQARVKLMEIARENGLRCAVDEPNRYAVMPSNQAMTRVFAEEVSELLAGIELMQTDRFANLELIETSETAIYFDRRWDADERVFYVSPLQVYLELANRGKREQETAAQIAEGLLNFRY